MKKRKRNKRLWIPALAAAAAMLFSGCEKKDESLRGRYTYNGILTGVTTFSPTDYDKSTEGVIVSYTTAPLWKYVMNETKDDYDTICVAATDFPTDVTSEYAGTGKYGIPDDAEFGYAWRFDIRDDMMWEDGTPITTQDFLYSVQQTISPEMKNYRASGYYDGSAALAGAEAYYFCEDGSVSFEDVGIVAEDDNTLTLIFVNPTREAATVIYRCMDINLVNRDLYEKLKVDSGGVIKSSYGTSKENYMSYGPYKITFYHEGKEMRLTRNEKYFGYHDEKFANQYMTTDIVLSYTPDLNTQLSSFLEGECSEVSIGIDQLDRYGTSDYIQYVPSSSIWELAVNTDYEALKTREKSGINKTILCYKDFRKAFSYAIDRQSFINQCLGIGTPAFGLLSNSYVCDQRTNLTYRSLPEANQLLAEVYEDTDGDISGYNVKRASELLASAYQQCLADGNISPDDIVELELHTRQSSSTMQKQVEFLENALLNAAVGTPLEDRIRIMLVANPDYYNSAYSGLTDLIFAGWLGGVFDPYDFMQVYVNPSFNLEYGFDTDAPVEMTINGEKITKSAQEWHTALCGLEYASAEPEVRNTILCQLEKYVLMNYHAIPLYTEMNASLIQQRIHFESDRYVNATVGYGTFEGITYTMDDAEWKKYCAENRLNMGY